MFLKIKDRNNRDFKLIQSGNLYAQSGRHEEAVLFYDRVNKKAVTREYMNLAEYNKAVSLFKLIRFEDALQCLDRVIQQGPQLTSPLVMDTDPETQHYCKSLVLKSAALQNIHMWKEALECHQLLLEYDDKLYAKHGYYKAICEEKIGKMDDAIKTLRKFLSEAPPAESETINHAKMQLIEWNAA